MRFICILFCLFFAPQILWADTKYPIILHGEHIDCAKDRPANAQHGKAFKDGSTDRCRACPAGYERNPFSDKSGDKACKKKSFTKYSKAKKVAKGSGVTGYKCKSGQHIRFKDKNCYVCPRGYKRTGRSLVSSKACSVRVKPRIKSLDLGIAGCPKGTKHHALSDLCYSCPAGTKRALTTKVDFSKRPKICKSNVKISGKQQRMAWKFIQEHPQTIWQLIDLAKKAEANPDILKRAAKDGVAPTQLSFRRFSGAMADVSTQNMNQTFGFPEAIKINTSVGVTADGSFINGGGDAELGVFMEVLETSTGRIGFEELRYFGYTAFTGWFETGGSIGADVEGVAGLWWVDHRKFEGRAKSFTVGLAAVYGASLSLFWAEDTDEFLGLTVSLQSGLSVEIEKGVSTTYIVPLN